MARSVAGRSDYTYRSVAGRTDYTYMAAMSFSGESFATDSSGASEVVYL